MASVTVKEKQLKQVAYEDVMTFKCPYCGGQLVAEPDAAETCCPDCDKMVSIINPYF